MKIGKQMVREDEIARQLFEAVMANPAHAKFAYGEKLARAVGMPVIWTHVAYAGNAADASIWSTPTDAGAWTTVAMHPGAALPHRPPGTPTRPTAREGVWFATTGAIAANAAPQRGLTKA